MSEDRRQTWGLIIDVLDVLEKHGYRRGDDQHTGRAVGLVGDLARIYEGTQEAPAGAYLAQAPEPRHFDPAQASPPSAENAEAIASAGMLTILSALDEASEYKRDHAAGCADCEDQSCGTCQYRLDAARAYESSRHPAPARHRRRNPGQVIPPGCCRPARQRIQAQAAPEREAGQ